ncbi:hypothetical protein [Lysinibacillus xylanilyticus]
MLKRSVRYIVLSVRKQSVSNIVLSVRKRSDSNKALIGTEINWTL